jgi:NADH:ubiquinone oxidoreductase subunit 3 (subunit A)
VIAELGGDAGRRRDQYLPLAVFMAVAAVISGALLVAPFLVAFKAPDPEKLSAYECGFNAFDDARMRFDVLRLGPCRNGFTPG